MYTFWPQAQSPTSFLHCFHILHHFHILLSDRSQAVVKQLSGSRVMLAVIGKDLLGLVSFDFSWWSHYCHLSSHFYSQVRVNLDIGNVKVSLSCNQFFSQISYDSFQIIPWCYQNTLARPNISDIMMAWCWKIYIPVSICIIARTRNTY